MMFEEIVHKRLEEEKDEIIKKSLDESKLETAKKFLAKDIDPTVIAECTGLPLEQVLQLQKEVMSPVAK